MTLKQTLKTSIQGLQTQRSRSWLTILGIVIGVSAIMLIMSLGSGAQALIVNQISGFGAENIVVRPGQEPKGPTDIGETILGDSLKDKDVEALQKKINVPEALAVMPFVLVPGSVSYQGETFSPTIFGGPADFLAGAFDVYPERGVLFGEQEAEQRASVAIIGSKVKNELFGESDALSEFIAIKDRKFRVVGVFPSKGQVAFLNIDEMVIVPHTTAQTYLLGIDHYHEIIVQTRGPEAVAKTVSDIERTLRQSHGISDPSKDDFFVVTQQGMVEQIQVILGVLTAFLSSVVAVALVVGGIGVMNIMLVSVSERTREIGLRKALGATSSDILNQFLLEAVLLTAAGGIIGIALGAALSLATAFVLSGTLGLDWTFVFPVSAVFLGLGVSGITGLVFGVYPARQAAKKSPIEALRYE